MPGPHRKGHERSLGRGFPARPLAFKGLVRPAFGLALYGGVLTRLSRPLGALDILSRACRPSRTAHLPLSRGSTPRLEARSPVAGVSLAPPRPPEKAPHWLPATLRTSNRASAAGCSKAPRGLLAPPGVPGLCTRRWVRRAPGRDSGDLVDPFMHAGTYPARHLATLRESELLPAFGGASPG